jgi:hypothetical protein
VSFDVLTPLSNKTKILLNLFSRIVSFTFTFLFSLTNTAEHVDFFLSILQREFGGADDVIFETLRKVIQSSFTLKYLKVQFS